VIESRRDSGACKREDSLPISPLGPNQESVNCDVVQYAVDSSISKSFRLPYRGFAEDIVERGDSSNPQFIYFKGEPVVLGHFWFTPRPGEDPEGTVGIGAFYSCPPVVR
jgi:hypothetical protein